MLIENISDFIKFDRNRNATNIDDLIDRSELDTILLKVYQNIYDMFNVDIEGAGLDCDKVGVDKNKLSLMQYLCSKVHEAHLYHHHSLYSYYLDRDVKYLNFGSGAGFLEFWFNYNKNNKDIVGLEWEGQDQFFSQFRKFYKVEEQCRFICNSIYEENFKIRRRGSDNSFNSFKELEIDTAIMHRFFPVWETESPERKKTGSLKRMFRNLNKYDIKEVLISTRSIESKMPKDDMSLISDNTRLKRHDGTWEMWFVNIENL